MHKAALAIFAFIKNVVYFLRIASIFFIMILSLYWIQNIIGASWKWMNIFKSPLDYLLSYTDNIYSVTFSMFGADIEFKYISALLLLVLFLFIFKFIYIGIEMLESTYVAARTIHKKTVEKNFNKKLEKAVANEEMQITNFSVLIHTQIPPKFSHRELNVNIDENNKLMNDYISKKTGVTHMVYDSGFLYTFKEFDKIDEVLSVLFKVLESNVQLEYAISIQAGNNLPQLKTLAALKIFGKVIIAADTLLRYKYKKTHRFQTANLGIFQKDNGSIEVHEFKQIL